MERKYLEKGLIFSTWFDVDNDGLRDLVIAVKELPAIWKRLWLRFTNNFKTQIIHRSEKWHVILYRNMTEKNHWLQFQLIGATGNRPAVGAAVEVTSPSGVQRQQIGQAEGAIRSQGHYRLYFGLGSHQQAISAKVYWPDGHVQEMANLTVDQFVVVQRDDVKVSRSTD